jgi:hypothetical protein
MEHDHPLSDLAQEPEQADDLWPTADTWLPQDVLVVAEAYRLRVQHLVEQLWLVIVQPTLHSLRVLVHRRPDGVGPIYAHL